MPSPSQTRSTKLRLHPSKSSRAELTQRQRQIWDLIRAAPPGARLIIGYGGAAGGGKTRAIVELAIDLALDYPGNRILIGRKDFSDLATTTMEQFIQHCPRALIADADLKYHIFRIRQHGWPEGVYSSIIFRELKDYQGIGSEEYGAVLLDEAGEIPSNSALYLLGRMRHQLPDSITGTELSPKTPWGRKGRPLKRIFMAASNPYPGWFEQWFIRRTLDEESLRQNAATTVHFVPALPADNPHLDPNYETSLRAAWPEDWVRRFMEGRWDAFTGQVYPMFSTAPYPDGHCYIGKLPPPSEWVRVIGGLDFGGLNPWDHFSAGMVAIQLKSGRIIRVAEFEERGENVYDRQLSWMLAQEARWCAPNQKHVGSRIIWVADRSQGLGIEQYRRMGFKIRPSKGGWDSVEWGIGLVARRFEKDGSGYPGSCYLDDLKKFPERVMAYHYIEPKDEEQSARKAPSKRNNDLLDADRYMHELLESPLGDPAPGQFPVLSREAVLGTAAAMALSPGGPGRGPVPSEAAARLASATASSLGAVVRPRDPFDLPPPLARRRL